MNILITGASKGVGACVANRLAGQGHTVFAWSRSVPQYETIPQNVDGRVIGMRVDISDWAAVEETAGQILGQYGHLDVLINNAGVVKNQEFAELDPEWIDAMIDTNLKGTLYVTRAFLPAMKERKSGRIINISSVAGTRGIPGQAVYCASKWGMNGFADVIAQECIQHGILVSSINPGAIDTPLWNEQNPYPGELDGVMQPEELADMVDFLLSQPARTLYKNITVFPTNEWH